MYILRQWALNSENYNFVYHICAFQMLIKIINIPFTLDEIEQLCETLDKKVNVEYMGCSQYRSPHGLFFWTFGLLLETYGHFFTLKPDIARYTFGIHKGVTKCK